MSESHSKLIWNVQGLFDNFSIIRSELEVQINSLPDNNKNKRNKMNKLSSELKEMEDTIQNIKDNKIVEIENYFGHKFTEPNLIILAFFQPETKNLFNQLKNHPFPKEKNYDFESYLNLDEAAKVLAFIGDAAISLAMTHVLWEPNISSTGELTVKRSKFVSNKNMSKLCDKWNLFDFRLGSSKNVEKANKEKMEHSKGTIIEALYGVLYIECGLEKVISSVVHLK
jgi:ribonuclease-3